MRQYELSRQTPYNTMAFRLFISFVVLTATYQQSFCTLAEDVADTSFNRNLLLIIQEIFRCEPILIECDNGNPSNYSLHRIEKSCPGIMVTIKNCPLSGDTPTVHLFEILKSAKVRALLFENTNLDANLERNDLSKLQNLESLIFTSKSLTHMAEDLFADLSNLLFLTLHANNLRLTEKLFEPLNSLIGLELQHNNMQTLPRGIFKNQRKLVYLNLTDNQLRNFTKDLIVDATSLARIYLNDNNIETFAPDVFQPLTNLQELYVDFNSVREIPYGLFANNKNLTEFSLTNNRVALILLPSALFANLPLLENVRLSCQLENVPEDLFANSTKLANLNMAKNRLAILPKRLLIGQIGLNVLDLSHNRLQTLPDEFFRYTLSLRELRLSYNKLEILGDILAYLPNLKFLHLDNNNFSKITFTAFDGLHSLELLNLANNKITTIDAKDIQEINCTSTKSMDGALASGAVHVNLNDNPLQCDCRIRLVARPNQLYGQTLLKDGQD